MIKTIDSQHRERGYVLLTSVMLLVLLTSVAVMMAYKSLVSEKISAISADSYRALAAAEAGLHYQFNNWTTRNWSCDANGDRESLGRILGLLQGKPPLSPTGCTATNYISALAPEYLSNPDGTVAANQVLLEHPDVIAQAGIDGYIQWADGSGGKPFVRVFEMSGDAIYQKGNSEWNAPYLRANEQVAVWSSYVCENNVASLYPYDTSTALANCSHPRLVVYALGRAGNSMRFMREFVAESKSDLLNMGALNNASRQNCWKQLCDPTASCGGSTSGWSGASQTNNILIDATQARDVSGEIPSGTALLSNLPLGKANSNFGRLVNDRATDSGFNAIPMIAYAGHNSTTNMKVDFADVALDTTTPNAPDLPNGKLPYDLVIQSRIDTNSEITLFSDSNPDTQAINIQAYRDAAEAFTTGAMVTQAEALRTSLNTSPTYSGIVTEPVTGRLTLAQFQYNVAHAIPMFGMVRVLYPTELDGNKSNRPGSDAICTSTNKAKGFDPLFKNNQFDASLMKPAGTYNTSSTNNLDKDGELGTNAKIIVYGSLFFDFFDDNDASFSNGDTRLRNGLYDSGESLLTIPDAMGVSIAIEVPILINPVMPYGAASSFAGVATGTSSNPYNLASPTGGYFPTTEGLIPVSSDSRNGSVRLMGAMGTANYSQNLIGAATSIQGGTSMTSAAEPLFSHVNVHPSLQYYDQLHKLASSAASGAYQWGIGNFPNTMSDDFAIGASDLAAGSNDGDKFHLLFPSGYLHGWKVALAALHLTAAHWNSLGSSQYFNITADAGSGYGLLDDQWRDIPALIYSGGTISLQGPTNISGMVYTPGPFEWIPGAIAQKNGGSSVQSLGYINGTILAGFGTYMSDETHVADPTQLILVYDPTSFDSIESTSNYIIMREFGLQELF
ncbi:MAG: hypothetical protein HQM07_00295 [Zetaproteobacteria bacterium]|nr:hypothetical protein [Zetaproteobacteria bacterium]